MENPSLARWGWLLVLALALASLGLTHWRLTDLPDLSVSLGPELELRTIRAEFDSAEELGGTRLQRGDRLITLGGQRVDELADVRIVASAPAFAPKVDPPAGESEQASAPPAGRRRINHQIVRPLHRFTISLADADVPDGQLPAGLEPNDKLVEVDGRVLPGPVGLEGARSIIASRPDAVLVFERRDAVFSGEIVAYHGPFRFGYLVIFGLLLALILAIWRFRDPELDDWSPALVGFESIAFAWVALLALRTMWVVSDPVLYNGVLVSLVMMRPFAFLSRARSSDEGIGPGAWGAFAIAVVASIVLVVATSRGLIESTEQALHVAALVALLYIVYEIVAGISKGGGATFGERSGYLAGFLALTCLGGLFAYFSEPDVFVEELWLWFAVIMAALVWFGDVLFAVRGRAGAVFADVVDPQGRAEVISDYLERVAELIPDTDLVLVAWEPTRSVAFRAGIAEMHIEQSSSELHDALSILVQERTTVPLPEGLDRHTDPMAGIAQTMEMSVAMAFAPPPGAITVPDLEIILVGFHDAPAGEIPHYANAHTLELAQHMLTPQIWVAALAEAVPVMTRDQPRSVRREDADAAQAEADRLSSELSEATSTLEFLRRDRSELAQHAQVLSAGTREFLFRDVDAMDQLLEPELLEGVDYLLTADLPILISGAVGAGKRFLAACVHERDERYPGEVAFFDAAPAGSSVEGMLPADELCKAVMGGALVVRAAQWLSDAQLETLAERSREDHRLILLFEDADAEVRSALDGRAADLQERWMSRELVLPNLVHRSSLFEPLLHHFLEQANRRYRKGIVGFSDEATRRITDYPWPGNIAQLKLMIDIAVSNARDEIIDVEDIDSAL